MHRGLCTCLLLLSVLAPGNLIWAQEHERQALASPPNFHQLTRTAGSIFAGKIVSIRALRAASAGTTGSVAVSVQIEQGIRGVRTGETVTFREWVGLWAAGDRYRVGERMVLFLYPPSALGLSSPVGGAAGKFALDREGQVTLTALQHQEVQRLLSSDSIDTKRSIPVRDFVRFLRRVSEE